MNADTAIKEIQKANPNSDDRDLAVIKISHQRIRELLQEAKTGDEENFELNQEQLAGVKKDFRAWFKPVQKGIGIEKDNDSYPGMLFDSIIDQAKVG